MYLSIHVFMSCSETHSRRIWLMSHGDMAVAFILTRQQLNIFQLVVLLLPYILL